MGLVTAKTAWDSRRASRAVFGQQRVGACCEDRVSVATAGVIVAPSERGCTCLRIVCLRCDLVDEVLVPGQKTSWESLLEKVQCLLG